jgi:hypothetical protein
MNNEYQEITILFSEYEQLFEQDPVNALKKMIDLYARADEVYNHEVADAIDMWIHANINDETVKYLKTKIIKNDNLNKIYSGWISGNVSD